LERAATGFETPAVRLTLSVAQTVVFATSSGRLLLADAIVRRGGHPPTLDGRVVAEKSDRWSIDRCFDQSDRQLVRRSCDLGSGSSLGAATATKSTHRRNALIGRDVWSDPGVAALAFFVSL
jgi:hypothetical protein